VNLASYALVALLGTSLGATRTEEPQLLESLGDPAAIDAGRQRIFEVMWNRTIVRTGFFRKVVASFGSPAISERYSAVVVGQGEGDIIAFSVDEGRRLWRYEHNAPFAADITLDYIDKPAAAEILKGGAADPDVRHLVPDVYRNTEVALCPASDGKLLSIDISSGLPVWTADLGAASLAPVTVFEDTLLVAQQENKIVAINKNTGEILWSEGRPKPTNLSVQGHSRATVHNGIVYAGFSDGYVEAFELKTGTRRWSRPMSLRNEEFVDVDADPIVADGRLFVASYSDGIYALNIEKKGAPIWSQYAPAVVSLATYDDLLIAASADGWVWGIDRQSGDMAYRVRMPAGPMSRLTVRENVIVFTAGELGLVVLDARSGKPLQATPFGDRASGKPTWEGERMALLFDAGVLFTLAPTVPFASK